MIKWQDKGCVNAPLDSSIFNPPGLALVGLLILNTDGDGPGGVETIDIPTINPPPDLPTTVIANSDPFNTTTNSPVF